MSRHRCIVALLWLAATLNEVPALAKEVLVVVDSIDPHDYPDASWWEKARRGIIQGADDFDLDITFVIGEDTQRLDAKDFPLDQVAAVVASLHTPGAHPDFFSRVNSQRIPIITFHTNNADTTKTLNSSLHISNSNYTLGVKTGERAALLGRLTYSCFYSREHKPFAEICEGFHFGASKLLLGAPAIVLPENNREARHKVIDELEDRRARLLISLDTRAAKMIEQELEKRRDRSEEDIFHISMAYHEDTASWLEEERLEFAFFHQPWLEAYLAIAAAATAMQGRQHDPVDIIVGIRSSEQFHNRLDAYGFRIHYEDMNIRSAPGIVNKDNVRKIMPLWGNIW